MCLNHPTTIPRPSMGKLSSTRPVPGVKKVGDCCLGFSLTYYFYWQSPHYKVSYDISLNVPSLKYLNNSEFLCQAKNTQIEY